ncbi:NAD(P)H-dependent oxidoreductase [Sanguibacter sp. 25GB23B1]|uniref:NADPH-dependent FMN reductase n=1 Tax=unclassified Sanguibacter TaxID=2645534 RepID=UPI0032AEBA2A
MGLSSAYALVGNPREGSRTASAATTFLAALAGDLDQSVVDLADLGPAVLDPGSTTASDAVAAISQARLLLVASPVYKGSYTGLLKAFLDRFPPGALAGVVAVPVMVGASPGHAVSAEAYLRPLLLELGATCPAPAVYLQEQTLVHVGAAVTEDPSVKDPIATWCAQHAWLVRSALAGARVAA